MEAVGSESLCGQDVFGRYAGDVRLFHVNPKENSFRRNGQEF